MANTFGNINIYTGPRLTNNVFRTKTFVNI